MALAAAQTQTPSRTALDAATVRVLAKRDLVRFFRQRSRVVGALAQPILFWLVIGSGFGRSFRAQGDAGVSYMQYFFPGVVAMVLLFSAIFATITVIEDRREGFLQSVLAGPGSRWAIVLGKCAGGSAIALLQATLFLGFAPFAQISFSEVSFSALAAVMVASALFLTGLGFALAWWINSSTGYHAVMSIVLIPMWVLSGAMFPVEGAGAVVAWIMRFNPMRLCVDGLRHALTGSLFSAMDWTLLFGIAAAAVAVSAWRVHQRE
jgi:ABC-2 type transport system permease protein